MARIMVVEDEDNVRTMFRLMLERAGYEVEEASDGEIALEHFHRDPFDLVVTDLVMPNKGGLDTIQELKEGYPDAKIIAITGWGLHLLPIAYDNGAARIFEKPVGQRELLGAVRELLGEEQGARV